MKAGTKLALCSCYHSSRGDYQYRCFTELVDKMADLFFLSSRIYPNKLRLKRNLSSRPY